MQWDDIRFFITLAREGSLSAAARKLLVEHSTVSRRVMHLEKSLQLKLFDRLPRGWVLTDEGQTFFTQAKILEENILSLQRSTLKDGTLHGEVQLSAPPHLLNYFILPYLDAFKKQYPHISLALIADSKNADMLRGEADIALRMFKPNEQELIARKIADVHYSLYASPAYLSQPPAKQQFIGFTDYFFNLAPKKWLENHANMGEAMIKTNDIMTMYQAAKQKWGIAILPDFMVQKGELIKIPTESIPTVPLYLVTHPDIRRAPKVKALIDFLVQIMENHDRL